MIFNSYHSNKKTEGLIQIACCIPVALILLVAFFLLLGMFGGGGSGPDEAYGGENDTCINALYPNITNDATYGNAIDTWIRESGGTGSPFDGLGVDVVAGAKEAGVNPAFIVSLARKESSFGTAGIATGGTNNAFGRQATESQPHITIDGTMWFKWTSFKASVNSTEDTIAKYLKRVYLDEGKTDIADIMPSYAPPDENQTQKYIEQVQQWMDEINEAAGEAIVCEAGDGTGEDPYITEGKVLNVPYYNQFRSDPNNCRGGSHWNFGSSPSAGCGITSQAMAESFILNKTVTPQIVYNRQGISYSLPILNSKIKSKGVSYSRMMIGSASEAEAALKAAENSIKKGYPAVAHVWPPFASKYHILLITGFDDNGNVYVNEPNCNRGVPPYMKLGTTQGKNNLASREVFKKAFYIDPKGNYPGGKGSRHLDYVK